MSNRINPKVRKIVAGSLIAGTLITNTNTIFADTTNSKYKTEYQGVGRISVAEEVGPNGNGGFISTGKGDAGGISYGLLQLTSKGGGASANKFVFNFLKEEYPKYYSFFKEADKAGTSSFSSAWIKAYNHNPGEFENIQLRYKEEKYVKPAVKMAKDTFGIDLLSSRARTEWVHSTSVQFGVKGTEDIMTNSGVTSDMDDEELISRLCQEKRNSVGTYKFLGCDKATQNSVYNRFVREEKEMLMIAKEEAGASLEDILNGEKIATLSKEELIENAEKYIGIPYKIGGKDTNAIDCSEFVSLVLNDSGIEVDTMNTNAGAFRNKATQISRDELKPGDLIFWHDKTGTKHAKVYHIGIYKGDGIIIDSSADHGGVGTRTLSSLQDNSRTEFSFGRIEELQEKLNSVSNPLEEEEIISTIEVNEDILDNMEPKEETEMEDESIIDDEALMEEEEVEMEDESIIDDEALMEEEEVEMEDESIIDDEALIEEEETETEDESNESVEDSEMSEEENTNNENISEESDKEIIIELESSDTEDESTSDAEEESTIDKVENDNKENIEEETVEAKTLDDSKDDDNTEINNSEETNTSDETEKDTTDKNEYEETKEEVIENTDDIKLETEEIVALSDSEREIQELEKKLENNLFHNIFTKLSI